MFLLVFFLNLSILFISFSREKLVTLSPFLLCMKDVYEMTDRNLKKVNGYAYNVETVFKDIIVPYVILHLSISRMTVLRRT